MKRKEKSQANFSSHLKIDESKRREGERGIEWTFPPIGIATNSRDEMEREESSRLFLLLEEQ
jgi:hypothetical protein